MHLASLVERARIAASFRKLDSDETFPPGIWRRGERPPTRLAGAFDVLRKSGQAVSFHHDPLRVGSQPDADPRFCQAFLLHAIADKPHILRTRLSR